MATVLTKKFIAALLKPRKATANKTDFGHALLIAGNTGKMGAAVMAAKACVRSGAGLTTVCVPQKESAIIQIAVPEAMVISRENFPESIEKYAALGIGPGIGLTKEDEEFFYKLFNNLHKALVIDADAITLLSKNNDWKKQLKPNMILTPHDGEFDRLFGPHNTQKQRLQKALEFSAQYNGIIVLKGFETAIVSNGNLFINKTGNPGLAKGGSGDVLTGMITALLAQGYEPLHAACMGVYLHGSAADFALAVQSPESMIATDVIEKIGTAFYTLTK